MKVLEAQGHTLHCIARTPAYLKTRVAPTTTVFAANVLDKESLRPALRGMDTAYYLIHSLGESKGFEEQEKVGAQNFADVARESGIKRIIYLGGWATSGKNYRRTCAADTRWEESCATRASQRWSFALQSFSDPEVFRSR